MLIGIIGAPNKGKSTLFSALTNIDAKAANYPFTTIDPNKGTAFVAKPCAEKIIGKKCKPRNSMCDEGMRLIPINVEDVAGLVPGAHEGKGMGNQFLSDLSGADAFIIVVDASGGTDIYGNPGSGTPAEDVEMIIDELTDWIAGIITKHMPKISKTDSGIDALANVLTGFNIQKRDIESSAEKLSLPTHRISWNEEETKSFAKDAVLGSKKFIIAANKSDSEGAKNNEPKILEASKALGISAVMCSAAIELALKKANSSGMIEYKPWERSIKIIGKPNAEQLAALNYMKDFVEKRGTGVSELMDRLVFNDMKQIVVYPVEDENRFSDSFGNVLPDAILMPSGSTAYDLAAKIHTDIAKGMLYAIDAVSKMRLGKGYVLKDGDIIKIVSAAK